MTANLATNLATKTPGKIIAEMPPAVFKTLVKVNPSGALQARKQISGITSLYWRYSVGTASERVLIGVYDPAAPPKSLTPTARGYSVAAAISAAETLALEHHRHKETGGRPALMAAKAKAKLQADAAKLEAGKQTLSNLLDDYCDHLHSLGRISHREARSILKLHVKDAWPELGALPANEVPSEAVADMMRRVLELGKGRTANKLRSYLRAAYQTARAARSKASIPVRFKSYNVTHNPAADTTPDEAENRADKNPLSAAELRTYWQTIKGMQGFKGAVLRLHLLTGGQRIAQLVALNTRDVTGDAVTLFDGKGRPGKAPRPHTVPLIPAAADALRECKAAGAFALSTDGGVTHLAGTTLSNWAVGAALEIPDFQAKRIRSGVETLLASVGLSSEVRGRLQSHGITGVQARHYDGHDYLDAKRLALETLFTQLELIDSKRVVDIKSA